MMMKMNFLIYMYLVGNMIFISKHKHLLIVLLSLEFIVLSVFILMMLSLNENNMYMLMVFLVFTVCEGVLGLSILVSMIRTHGNDYFQSYNLL